MKVLLFFFVVFFFSIQLSGQSGQWIWMNGDNTTNSPGNYGTKGIPSPLNKPPGLYGTVRWKDMNGMFWIYGGGKNGWSTVDDLWMFNPYTNEWTWVGGTTGSSQPIYGTLGVPSPLNYPGDRGFGVSSWSDSIGNLWMYGGMSSSSIVFSDLWKYNIATNQWTWMSGGFNQIGNYGSKGIPASSNSPGSRFESIATWVDSTGNLCMYGGYYSGFLDDVWKYDVSTGLWVWIAGDSLTNVYANHGTMGVANNTNTPGGRCAVSSWKDKSGNFWIFGGNTLDTNLVQHAAADLWKFDIHTLEWTWVNGSLATGFVGNYGPYCNQDSSWLPAGRYEDRASAVDNCGNFYMYAGGAFDPNVSHIWLFGDLWRYQVQQNRWQLLSGNGSQNTSPHYSGPGVANILNQPGSRSGSVAWFDSLNNYWMFGGISNLQGFNDIWKFEIDSACADCAQLPVANFMASDSAVCAGECINFINLSKYADSYQWFFPGGTSSTDTATNPQAVCYYASGIYDVILIASNNDGTDTLTMTNYVTIYPALPFSAITKIGDTLFSAAGYTSYEWYYGSSLITGANNYYYVASQNGNYTVIVTDSNGCKATAQMIDVIASVNNIIYSGNYFTAYYDMGNIYLDVNMDGPSSSVVEVSDAIGKGIYHKSIFLENGKNMITLPIGNISAGVYIVTINNSMQKKISKFFIK